ncbi:3-oxoacyl-[acyl-carrier protein] reductase [Cystobacter fuscus DSM 2262]|uniref:3-oxoacyl-[acyl-carrier protein] reductase n=1 Tax=Cystobacter fuscus (strain ATCC 25194 / DSM 2262 / NBRC 100088 / M29) TaxID=1242864 RepID=S9P421_CYSF2|nr:SDR family oxidoreductase [Cystobacter fuscus]EPX56992.1 3-oxoacyl-[acyl-carrier protein] reductase [Cystobacter fuscus DSM 2262]
MNGRLAGKAALVTGSGSGIGRATALLFAREGARVIVSDVNVSGAEETVAAIQKKGGEARFIRCDVSKSTEVEALIRGAVEAFGRLDCAVNNAGISGVIGPTGDYPEEAWDRVIATNLTGVWLCMKQEIQQMLKQGGGCIANTASVAGLVGFPMAPAYTAAKHGVVGLTKTAALEYAKANIRINAVCPGLVRTPMITDTTSKNPQIEQALIADEPVGRMADPEEIAEALVWLCSGPASFITGAALPVDGGVVAR